MSSRLPRVVYWNNVPAPYMVERFNAVADRGSLDFEAWFAYRDDPGRSWDIEERQWSFPYRYVASAADLLEALRARRRPDVVVSLYAAPLFLAGWAAHSLQRVRTALWVEVTFSSWVRRTYLKERAKRLILPRADMILTAGRDGSDYACSYGVAEDRVRILPHAIDGRHFRTALDYSDGESQALRSELGLSGTVFLYVGRMWLKKGLLDLIDAFRLATTENGLEASLLLVGDGPDLPVLREHVAGLQLSSVRFLPFVQKPDLPRYYAAADVFVFPTLGDPYGLVVDEAMTAGLPVIATTATGEVHARIIDGQTGRIVHPANRSALADAMVAIGSDPGRWSDRVRRTFVPRTPEDWASTFESIVSSMLARPPRQLGLGAG